MYHEAIVECQRRIELGNSLRMLMQNPDYQKIISEGFLRDEVLKKSLNINKDKSGTVQFLKGVSTLNEYFCFILTDAEVAKSDLNNHLQLIQDAR